jgi:hypothetical protein
MQRHAWAKGRQDAWQPIRRPGGIAQPGLAPAAPGAVPARRAGHGVQR